MKIAVTGATGQLGRLVIAGLIERVGAGNIVALVRSPEKAADLGVEARLADYDRPETLGPALAGVDELMLISGNEIGKRAPQHRAIIAAAQAAGVSRIVYTSLLRADTSPLGLAEEHFETEAAIRGSGLDYTILRNGWYTENYTASIPGALHAGAFAGSAGQGRISSATRADFAEAAIAVLSEPGHEGKVYELAGDDAYTLADLAAEVSAQTGRDIPYRDMPVADYAALLVSVGLPQAAAELVAGFDAGAAEGALFHDGRDLSRLIGRPTTPLASAVAAALA